MYIFIREAVNSFLFTGGVYNEDGAQTLPCSESASLVGSLDWSTLDLLSTLVVSPLYDPFITISGAALNVNNISIIHSKSYFIYVEVNEMVSSLSIIGCIIQQAGYSLFFFFFLLFFILFYFIF
jgi:hypothetical protein